jgi:hypothetical protein
MADTAPEGWRGPFVGEDAYGNPDHEYYQCTGCGVEVVTSIDVETVTHAEDCEVAE